MFKAYFIFSLLGGTIMLVSMIVGELIFGPIFGGFINRPDQWVFAFLETIVWVIPLTWLSAMFVKKFSKLKNRHLILASFGLWLCLSLAVFFIYHFAGDSRLPIWNEAKLGLPYWFGWYIPGILTILGFSVLSPIYFKRGATGAHRKL